MKKRVEKKLEFIIRARSVKRVGIKKKRKKNVTDDDNDATLFDGGVIQFEIFFFSPFSFIKLESVNFHAPYIILLIAGIYFKTRAEELQSMKIM